MAPPIPHLRISTTSGIPFLKFIGRVYFDNPSGDFRRFTAPLCSFSPSRFLVVKPMGARPPIVFLGIFARRIDIVNPTVAA